MITVITKNGLEFNFGDKGWLAKEVSQAFYLASCMFCEKCTEFIYNFLEKKSLKVVKENENTIFYIDYYNLNSFARQNSFELRKEIKRFKKECFDI